ncbi:MAG: Mov34/MPN/PAD-1 family protein [Alphaproteobacteria bacterium]|nr:Mov34/MPN/PAD-1 family protein [Alphaproteobacteria bacterium]MDE2111404.1 Mov34/MPN/PAD-1 family protein [Alphaproteobacteria bacterium]MDE2495543.1 Mov34/MPN/PAD-1 family protein [Alphaproteobacteria bacterium]
MISILVLPQALRAQLAAEAQEALPRECCGLIEGVRDFDCVRALTLHPTANFCADAHSFEIDPAAHLRLRREARVAGHEIVGCYHSHPNGQAMPSAHDRAFEGQEGFLWLIAALGESGSPVVFAAFEGAYFREISLAERAGA